MTEPIGRGSSSPSIPELLAKIESSNSLPCSTLSERPLSSRQASGDVEIRARERPTLSRPRSAYLGPRIDSISVEFDPQSIPLSERRRSKSIHTIEGPDGLIPAPSSATSSATSSPRQIETKASRTRVIQVLGPTEVGKTTFLHSVRRLSEVCLGEEPRRRRKSAVRGFGRLRLIGPGSKKYTFGMKKHECAKDAPGENWQVPEGRYFVLVLDPTPASFDYAQIVLPKLVQHGKNNEMQRVVVLWNKIDQLAESQSGSLSPTTLLPPLLSLVQSTGFPCLPISLNSIENALIDGQEPTAPFIRRQIRKLLMTLFLLLDSHRTLQWRYRHNQMSSMLFQFYDSFAVAQEGSVEVLMELTAREDKQQLSLYAIVKGEFLFLVDLERPSEVRMIYLPPCTITTRTEGNRTGVCLQLAQSLGQVTLFVGTLLSPPWKDACTTPDGSLPMEMNDPAHDPADSQSPRSIAANEISQFLSRLKKELTHGLPEPPFSAFLALCATTKCADCGAMGSYSLSYAYRILLCTSCAVSHSQCLDEAMGRIVSLRDILQQPLLWSSVGPRTNEEFNVLWESQLKTPMIQTDSATDARDKYVRSKYTEKRFYGCPKEPLYIKMTENFINRWEPRYLWIQPDGEIKIFGDSEHRELLECFHVSWCSFRTGKALDIDGRYLHLIGPGSSNLFRASSPEMATQWAKILENSVVRMKTLGVPPSLTTPAQLLRRHQRASVALLDSSSVTIGNVRDILLEKAHLVGLRKLRSQRVQLRAKLLQQLQETNAEIQGLEETEGTSLRKIENLETSSIVEYIQELQALQSYPSTTTTGQQQGMSPRGRSCPDAEQVAVPPPSQVSLEVISNEVVTPRFASERVVPSSQLVDLVTNTMNAIHNGVLEYDADTGYIIAGTTNRLFASLADPYYSESEFLDLYLYIIPYLMPAEEFLRLLSQRFACAHIKQKVDTKMNRSPVTKHTTITTSSQRDKAEPGQMQLDLSHLQSSGQVTVLAPSDATVLQIRHRLLSILEIWMNSFWEGDFARDPHLMIFVLSFLDYIVLPLRHYQTKADCLRNLFQALYTRFSKVEQVRPRATSSVAPANMNVFLLDSEPLDLARHLCLQNQEIYGQVRPRELVDKAWLRADRAESAPNVILLTERFNRITNWFSTLIVSTKRMKLRVKLLERCIQIAIYCREMGNFHALVAIVGALQDSAVRRCHKTWKGVSSKLTTQLDELIAICSVEGNWAEYRTQLNKCRKAGTPCVPYIGTYLRDLVFMEDGMNSYVSVSGSEEQVVNFKKLRMIANTIKEVLEFQRPRYDFVPNSAMSATLEIALTLCDVLSEQERYEMSLQIEPKQPVAPKPTDK